VELKLAELRQSEAQLRLRLEQLEQLEQMEHLEQMEMQITGASTNQALAEVDRGQHKEEQMEDDRKRLEETRRKEEKKMEEVMEEDSQPALESRLSVDQVEDNEEKVEKEQALKNQVHWALPLSHCLLPPPPPREMILLNLDPGL
jgi:hypothetical protein